MLNWKSEKGFTLPEMLLAALIASFALCGILLTYVTCMDSMRVSKTASIATSAAQGLLEEIRSFPFPQIVTNYDGFSFTVNGIPSSIGVVSVDDTNPEFLLVTINVTWQQNGRNTTVELVTQVANR